MARRNHLDDFTRGRMIGKLEEGHTVTSVAAELRINKSVVSRAYNTKERHRYGGSGVPVWGGIMLKGRTKLHILDRRSVTGDSYCDAVLFPHVRLFRGAIGPDFIFMDANARPHWTLAVEELLESEDITRMSMRRRWEATIAVRGGHIPY
ncbi:transposable element Tcb2 transposase [Trichonephila clavipes]|nr:transposable element Tcb2 transposase [Trichonephila clavipes]